MSATKSPTLRLADACISGDAAEALSAISEGANVNYEKVGKRNSVTPLLGVAAKKGHANIVEILLDHGADWRRTQKDTEATALHLAAKYGHVDVVLLLHKRGVPIDYPSASQWQALHYAAVYGRIEVLDVLLQLGADINATTQQGCTAICMAARNWKTQVIKYLLSKNADPNICDADGMSPVMHACRVGALSAIKVLVEEGKADVTLHDKLGNTALDEADKMGQWECALYVWEKGCDSGSLKKTRGLDPVRWIRPRIFNSPSARYLSACTSIGSRIFLIGGSGLNEGMVNSDPDNPPSGPSGQLNDFYMMDVEELTKTYIVDLHEKKTKKNITLSTTRVGRLIKVHDDLLTCETVFEVDEDEDSEATSIQASEPFVAEDGFGYFEIEILHAGTKGIVTLGLTDEKYPLDKIPGWVTDSFAFHGDDGSCFRNCGHGKPWGIRYRAGDVVGCGINFKTREGFFTLNGEFLGVAYKGIPGNQYYATIGFRNPLAKVRANFSGPFQFNFEVPTLSWTKLPQDFRAGDVPPAGRNFIGLFPLDSDTLLHLNDFRHTYEKLAWLYHIEAQTWELIQCDGARPIVLQDHSAVYLKGKVYVYVYASNENQGIPTEILPKFPALFVLDWETREWMELMPRLLNVPAEYLETIKPNIAAIDMRLSDTYKNSPMVVVEDELVFIGNNSILFVNPETMTFREKQFIGARPNARLFSAVVVGRDIETFGGWDERRQQNDVNILDTNEATWYKPHVYGPMPRPRNYHQACIVRTKVNRLAMLEDETGDVTESTTSNPHIQNTYIAHMFGWNGRNFIDDFELLALDTKQTPDALAGFINSSVFSDVTLATRDGTIGASRIILAARSSYFRHLFSTESGANTVVKLNDIPMHLLRALLNYLYSDVLDTETVQRDSREFVKFVAKYAPEQLNRIRESLVLTRMTASSTFGKEMLWAVNNQLFHDVVFVVGGEHFYAHKIVLCARSAYFNALLTGGLKESSEKEIYLPDTSPQAFASVLRYVYTKELDVVSIGEYIMDVFALACQYDLKSMKHELEDIIAFNLTVENVVSILVMADGQRAVKLKTECCKFILAQREEVKAESQDYMQYADLVEQLLNEYTESIQQQENERQQKLLEAAKRREESLAALKTQ